MARINDLNLENFALQLRNVELNKSLDNLEKGAISRTKKQSSALTRKALSTRRDPKNQASIEILKPSKLKQSQQNPNAKNPKQTTLKPKKGKTPEHENKKHEKENQDLHSQNSPYTPLLANKDQREKADLSKEPIWTQNTNTQEQQQIREEFPQQIQEPQQIQQQPHAPASSLAGIGMVTLSSLQGATLEETAGAGEEKTTNFTEHSDSPVLHNTRAMHTNTHHRPTHFIQHPPPVSHQNQQLLPQSQLHPQQLQQYQQYERHLDNNLNSNTNTNTNTNSNTNSNTNTISAMYSSAQSPHTQTHFNPNPNTGGFLSRSQFSPVSSSPPPLNYPISSPSISNSLFQHNLLQSYSDPYYKHPPALHISSLDPNIPFLSQNQSQNRPDNEKSAQFEGKTQSERFLSSPRPYFGVANSQIVIRDDAEEGEGPSDQLLRSLNEKGMKFLTPQRTERQNIASNTFYI
jgi:hypothetical protein